MKRSTLILAGLLVLLGMYFGGKIGSYFYGLKTENKRLHTELIGQKEQYKQLSDHAASLEIQYVDQQRLNKELEAKFANERDSLKGRIKVLSNATFLIREKARKSGRSDLVYKGKRLKYVLNEIRYNDGPPVGYVLIFDNGNVVSKLYNHELSVNTAVSRDEGSGRYDIVSKADFILRSPSLNTNGEKNWYKVPYPLTITGGKAFVDPTEPNQLKPKFHWWAPHLNMSIDFNREISPGLGVSLAGYGVTKNDLDWRFVNLGAHYNETDGVEATLVPAMYRPFSNILSNTYIGPGIQFGDNGIGYFLGLQVGL